MHFRLPERHAGAEDRAMPVGRHTLGDQQAPSNQVLDSLHGRLHITNEPLPDLVAAYQISRSPWFIAKLIEKRVRQT